MTYTVVINVVVKRLSTKFCSVQNSCNSIVLLKNTNIKGTRKKSKITVITAWL